MKDRKKWTALCCAIVLLAAQGCSSDDDGDFDPPDPIAEAEETVGQVTDEVIQPILTILALAQIPLSPAPPAGTGTCNALSECTSGSGEVCVTGPTGYEVILDQCVVSGISTDGTVTLSITSQVSADALFNVFVDGTQLTGSAALSVDPSLCLQTGFSNFQAGNNSGETADVVGTIQTCDGSPFPQDGGFLQIEVFFDGGDSLSMGWYFNGTPTAEAFVYDASGMPLANCVADLVTALANCSTGAS
jgi:hypothetical protein